MSRKENKIAQRIILSLIASMVTMSLSAQVNTKRPSLVVGIMIEGLDQMYIDQLRSYFGEKGFNRLLKDGVILQNVDYGTPLDNVAATAMLYTGAAPSVNGIPSQYVFNYNKGLSHPILFDSDKIGNYTNETYSPKALSVSTLSDELKIDGDGLNQIHSIAPDAQQSIIMSGHAANSAFWINDASGKWASTTYYKDVPSPISTRNYKYPLSARLDTISWTPSMDIGLYPDVPEHRRTYPFRYTFPNNDVDRYRKFKESACVNNEITSIAIDYIKSHSLGSHKGLTDMINIAYNLTPYEYSRDAYNRVETMDAYIKLDRSLTQLFDFIDSSVGIDNTLVFVAGTPSRLAVSRDDERWNIPHGVFSYTRATSFSNLYLSGIYNRQEWVKGIYNNQIYLNHKAINDSKLNITTIRKELAEFLSQMEGIANVYTIDDILLGKAGEQPEIIRRNTNFKYSGDIIFTIIPGWEIEKDDKTNNIVVRNACASAPIYILTPSVEAQTITYPVDARAIAPTVARLLRIRSPNAAASTPLHF